MWVDDTGGFVVRLPGGICAGYDVMDQALDEALEGAFDLEIAAFNAIRWRQDGARGLKMSSKIAQDRSR